MADFHRTTIRTARKTHQCAGCLQPIPAGARHAEHVAAPGDELGNVTWWRLRECWACLERYSRAPSALAGGAT